MNGILFPIIVTVLSMLGALTLIFVLIDAIKSSIESTTIIAYKNEKLKDVKKIENIEDKLLDLTLKLSELKNEQAKIKNETHRDSHKTEQVKIINK